MVRCGADDRWSLSLINTHLGASEYVVMSAWQKLGYEAMYEWLAREATPDQIEAMARMITSRWDPMALEPGDLDALKAYSQIIQSHPSSRGYRLPITPSSP
jgi:hypothetical protein